MLSFFTTSFAVAVRPVTAPAKAAAVPARAAAVRARRAPRRTRRHLRTVQFLLGLVTVGIGVACLIRADLGVASWDVLHVGLASRTGASVGVVSAAVAVVAVGLAALLGERPRAGTLVPVAVVAPTIDVALHLVSTPATALGQGSLLLGGMLLLSLGVGAYVASDHGAGPGDLVFLGVAKLGAPLWVARAGVDGILVLVGWLVGGPVGVGTVIVTAGLGPLIAVTMRVFDLAPARDEVHRRDAEFDHAWGLDLHRELEGV